MQTATSTIAQQLQSALGTVKFDTLLFSMSANDLIAAIKEIRTGISSNVPAYCRSQKNTDFFTVWNAYGRMLSTSHSGENCTPVKSHKQFHFTESNYCKVEKYCMFRLAILNKGFKVFQNGNLYAETKVKIEQLIAA